MWVLSTFSRFSLTHCSLSTFPCFCMLLGFSAWLCLRGARVARYIFSLLLCARHVYNSQFRLYTKYDTYYYHLRPDVFRAASTQHVYIYFQAAAHLLVLICYEKRAYLRQHTLTHKKPWRQRRVYLYRWKALGTTSYDLAFLGRRRATSSAMFILYVSADRCSTKDVLGDNMKSQQKWLLDFSR